MAFESQVKFNFLGCVICIPSGAFAHSSVRRRAEEAVNESLDVERTAGRYVWRYREMGIPAGMEDPLKIPNSPKRAGFSLDTRRNKGQLGTA